MAAADWTEDRTAALTRLWDEGLSASQIATRLGGITRNGVIGKVHRMGLPRRARSTPRRARPSAMQPVQKKPALKPAVKIDLSPAPSLGLSILDLRSGQCRFSTHENAGEYRFCGHDTKPGSSYCEAHWFVTVDHGRTARAKRKNGKRTDPDIVKLRDARRQSGLVRIFG